MSNHKREKRLDVEGVTCPRCGIGTLSLATVNETLRVGTNAVEVTVEANVCNYCDEHWLDLAAQTVIDTVIRRLRTGDMSHLEAIGELYRAS